MNYDIQDREREAKVWLCCYLFAVVVLFLYVTLRHPQSVPIGKVTCFLSTKRRQEEFELLEIRRSTWTRELEYTEDTIKTQDCSWRRSNKGILKDLRAPALCILEYNQLSTSSLYNFPPPLTSQLHLV